MKEINIRDIKVSAPELISDGWGLVTCGTGEKFNTMTVSWGALGEIWGKDAAFIFIRKRRYTYEFLESNSLFTLSFYDKKHRDALTLCGKKSGRDIDKVAETGLTPVFTDGTVTFGEAKYTLVCRIMGATELTPDTFLDSEINDCYDEKTAGDYHKMYIAEIVKVYEN